MTTQQLGPDASDIFFRPHSNEGYIDYLMSPEEPAVQPEEIRHALESYTAQLSQDADALAVSSERQQFDDIIHHSFSERPEIGAPPELETISEIGRDITRLRTARISKLLKQERLLRFIANPKEDRMMRHYKTLVERDSWFAEPTYNRRNEKIVDGVFERQPDGPKLQFYFENSNGKDEWFLIRHSRTTDAIESTVRYVLEAGHIRSVKDGEVSVPLSPEELANFEIATKRYHAIVSDHVYGEKPTRRGERKRARKDAAADIGQTA